MSTELSLHSSGCGTNQTEDSKNIFVQPTAPPSSTYACYLLEAVLSTNELKNFPFLYMSRSVLAGNVYSSRSSGIKEIPHHNVITEFKEKINILGLNTFWFVYQKISSFKIKCSKIDIVLSIWLYCSKRKSNMLGEIPQLF